MNPQRSALRRQFGLRTAVAVCGILTLASLGFGQFRRFRQPQLASPLDFDGGFQLCRMVFRNAPAGDGGGWAVDYPRADENLSIRLSELTKTPVSFDAARNPRHLLVRLTSPELFRCPILLMSEPGGSYFDDAEAAALRTYLLKGGFLWADDFWGDYAWTNWEQQIRKALPADAYAISEIPLEHPLFHEVMNLKRLPQIPSINFWAGSGGRTSERGPRSAVPHARSLTDHAGRVMVLMTFNTDFGDAFEREGDNREYFERFAVEGYAFGINTLVYAMTH